jgi:hypothetical protein
MFVVYIGNPLCNSTWMSRLPKETLEVYKQFIFKLLKFGARANQDPNISTDNSSISLQDLRSVSR